MSRHAAALFKNPPGPSPWYLRGKAAGIPGCRWQDAGDGEDTAGVVALVRQKRPVLLLDFYNYVLPMATGLLLIWHQQRDSTGPTSPIVLRLFRAADLAPLDADTAALCRRMRKKGESLVAGVKPMVTCEVPTTIVSRERKLAFPTELQSIDELLMLGRSSGIQKPARGDLALVVARPADGTYQLYPQDWFNIGEWDYGYEWVTRVARHPKTKKIHGDGIRLGSFVLDRTLRDIER